MILWPVVVMYVYMQYIYIYIYIYMYTDIYLHTHTHTYIYNGQPQTNLFRSIRTLQCGLTGMILEARIKTWQTETPIEDSTTQPRGNQHKRMKFKRLCITFVFVFIYTLIYIYIYIYLNIYIITVFKSCRIYKCRAHYPGLSPPYIYIYIYIYIYTIKKILTLLWLSIVYPHIYGGETVDGQ